MSAVPLHSNNLDFADDVLHLCRSGLQADFCGAGSRDRIRGVRTSGKKIFRRSLQSMTNWQQRW